MGGQLHFSILVIMVTVQPMRKNAYLLERFKRIC
jgi:hypothetical protein